MLPQYAPIGYIPRTADLALSPEDAAKEARLYAASTSGLPTPPLTPTSSIEDLRDNSGKIHKRREFIHASVVKLDRHSVTFTRPGPRRLPAEKGTAVTGPSGHFEGPEETLQFDYCLYALGAALPDPTNPWSEHPNMPEGVVHDHVECGLGSKKWGVRWMEQRAERLKAAPRIVVVGGGALGIQFAADLKDVYPDKEVTLLHSRHRMMPLYPQALHDEGEPWHQH